MTRSLAVRRAITGTLVVRVFTVKTAKCRLGELAYGLYFDFDRLRPVMFERVCVMGTCSSLHVVFICLLESVMSIQPFVTCSSHLSCNTGLRRPLLMGWQQLHSQLQ